MGTGVEEESRCGALLRELQNIWDDIEETEDEKNQILSEIDEECMVIYKKKVDNAKKARTELHQSLAAKETEVAAIVASLGESPPYLMDKISSASVRGKLFYVANKLEKLKVKKEERIKQFTEVRLQIEKIVSELIENEEDKKAILGNIVIEEHNLSTGRLTDYHSQLRALHKEKSDRLHKVLEYVNQVQSLCDLIGLDFGETVDEIHPSLHEMDPGQSTNISNNTLEGLAQTVQKLREEMESRTVKLRETLQSLFELWHVLDSPEEERHEFRGLACIIESPAEEIARSGFLSTEILEQIEAEVERLTKLKINRMKGLILSRISELQEECKRAHIEPEMSIEKTVSLIDSGAIDPSDLLASIEAQIVKVKEETASRKEIMDRISRWLNACEEENWLEEYNQDTNRYNAGRGAHLNLKRAEKARNLVSKIPTMVVNLITRTYAWEDERNRPFLYDGVRLISVLEEYKLARQQKEEEKKRLREQKKLQSVLLKEKERQSNIGSKPLPKKSNSFDRKTNRYHANGNANGMMTMTPTPRRVSAEVATPAELHTPCSHPGYHTAYTKEPKRLSIKPLNFFDAAKDDSMSTTLTSISGSDPESLPFN